MNDLAKLLDALGRDPTETLSINVRRGGGFSTHSRSVAEIPSKRIPDDADIWYGVAPLHERVNGGRGTANDAVGIRELFADLDVKPGGMPTWEAATQVVDTLAGMLGTAPVATVNSGHGLQPHWWIERCDATDWGDDNDPRWLDAVAIYRRWGRLVASVAGRFNGSVDNVYDLARILRAPGSVNHKAEPVPVTTAWGDPVPVSLGRVLETLDDYGVSELDGDRDILGETIAPPTDWRWSDATCGYVAVMIANWGSDTPDNRHDWLGSQCVRLACAHRLGCITEDDHRAATTRLDERVTFLRTQTGDPVQRHEVANWPAWGATLAATFTEERARRELGGHEHGEEVPAAGDVRKQRVRRTVVSQIKVRRARWLWHLRLALGTLSLLAGREGIGKSTIAYWAAARITRGELPGEDYGRPRSVLICATEDDWECTIAPRLMAHGADLHRVYRIDVELADNVYAGLSLPRDLVDVADIAAEVDAALLILDPLLSRLESNLDSHIDAEVRRALEPLVSMAQTADLCVWGIIHFNKSGATDPLELVMASKAFTAVARTVSAAVRDPHDETGLRCLFGTPKNNLGPSNTPLLPYVIESWTYDTDDGEGEVGRLVWGTEVEGDLREVLAHAGRDPDEKSATEEAAEWLSDYMEAYGPKVASAEIKREAEKLRHALRTVHRARKQLKLKVVSEGFPKVSYWVDERPVVPNSARGDPAGTTEMTEGRKPQVSVSRASRAIDRSPQESGTTNRENERERGSVRSGRSSVPSPYSVAPLNGTRPCSECNGAATDISELCAACLDRVAESA